MTGITWQGWREAAADARAAADLRLREYARGIAASDARRWMAAIIVGGTLLRLVFGAAIGLGVDESYEVAVSRRFSLSYFDHPPLSFWMIDAIRHLTGSEQAVVVRLPFIVCFALSTWLMYRLTARMFGERAGLFASLALSISPVFSLTAGGWALPDGPLMCAELAAATCLVRVLVDESPPHALRWWIASGVFSGVAILSKYHGVFLIAGTGLFLLTRRASWRWLAHPGPYVAAVIALGMAAPILVWNARHGWVSFLFQGGRSFADGASLSQRGLSLLQSVGGQIGYLLPWIWVPLVAVLVRALYRGPADARRWLLVCLAIGPIALFTLAALGGNPGLPHWEAPGYLLLFPLLGDAAARLAANGPFAARRVRRWLVASTAAYLVLLSIAATHAATGWMQSAAPSWFRRGDPTYDLIEWSALRDSLGARGLLDGRRVVAATDWMNAAKVAQALGPRVPVLCLCKEPHHFAYTYPPEDYAGRDVVLVERADVRGAVRLPVASDAHSLVADAPVMITRAGRPAIRLDVFRASLLAPPPSTTSER